jgi:predicted Zn-dependent protease with MMP-like domain
MERFEELVTDALDSLPESLAAHIDNVVVCVEEAHPSEDLLGLYEGTPLTEREAYGMLELPDTITLYRNAICLASQDDAEVVEQVRVTVVHEVAHHFGLGDDALEELGWA